MEFRSLMDLRCRQPSWSTDFHPLLSDGYGCSRLAGKEGRGSREQAGFSFLSGLDVNRSVIGQNGPGKFSLDPGKIAAGAKRFRKNSGFRTGFQESRTC
jgi:hypothetical protein